MIRPEALLKRYPEIDFLVAEGDVSSRYMVSIHRAFYQFAAEQCAGRTVLDAGCGTAFGTSILAEKARYAVGIDVKDLLLAYARQEYSMDRLAVARMDACRLAFRDGSFEALVADELIEHLPEHVPFLEEATRVLKPGGVFVCATVNRAHSFGTGDDPLNRNHFREYDAEEFRDAMLRYFQEVDILGQGFGSEFERYMHHAPARGIEWILLQLNIKHRIPARWRAQVRRWLTGVDAQSVPPEAFRVTSENVERSVYLVAVARGPRRAPGP